MPLVELGRIFINQHNDSDRRLVTIQQVRHGHQQVQHGIQLDQRLGRQEVLQVQIIRHGIQLDQRLGRQELLIENE